MKSLFKKIALLLSTFVLAFSCVFAGCEVISTAPQENSGGGNTQQGGGNTSGGNSDSGDRYEGGFTVKLKKEDGTDFGDPKEVIVCIWRTTTGNFEAEAEFDENGIAHLKKGDPYANSYNVNLDRTPEGYIYNPNIYTCDNKNPNIEITLYSIADPDGLKGNGWYDADVVVLSSDKAFRAKITPLQKEWYYRFTPMQSGDYIIESWADTVENVVNPICEKYEGQIGFVKPNPEYVLNGGGESNTYTKNFRFIFSIGGSYVGNPCFFKIKAETESNQDEILVDFYLKWTPYSGAEDKTSIVIWEPEELKTVPAPVGNWTPSYTEVKNGGSSKYLFANKVNGVERFVYNEDDGFYHVENKTGPILYSIVGNGALNYGNRLISFADFARNRYNDLIIFDKNGNGVDLSFALAGFYGYVERFRMTENFTVSTAVYEEKDRQTTEYPVGSRPYDCEGKEIVKQELIAYENITYHWTNYLLNVYVEGSTSPTKYYIEYFKYEEFKKYYESTRSYVNYAVRPAGTDITQSVYPVTKELKEMLQMFVKVRQYFYDGFGLLDAVSFDEEGGNASVVYDAYENDMWLLTCGYFKNN